jgi:hypothetical protein
VTRKYFRAGFVTLAASALTACAAVPDTVVNRSPTPPPEPIPAISSVTGTYLAAKFAASQGEIEGAAAYYADLLEYDPGNSDLLARTFLFAASAGPICCLPPQRFDLKTILRQKRK